MKLVVQCCIKVCLFLFICSAPDFGLSPDEAQYWLWSQSLDWAYYSKPAGIAWQLAFIQKLFGSSELALRSSALFFSLALTWAVFAFVRQMVCEKTALYAAQIVLWTPIGLAASLFATTDIGFLFFFTLALWMAEKKAYLRCGAFLALAALWKFPQGYFLWLPIVLAYREINWRFIAGVCLSLLGLLPTLIWNSTHGFVTFLHIFPMLTGVKGLDNFEVNASPNLLEFIGAQAALWSPILFCLALWSLFQRQARQKLPVAFWTTVLLCALALLRGSFAKIQVNWFVLVMPAWTALLALTVQERPLRYGLRLSYVMLACVAIIVWTEYNPVRLARGWKVLENDLLQHNDVFLITSSYQDASIVSYYAQKRAYLFNIFGRRHSHFSFFSPSQEIGKDALFVAIVKDAPLHFIDECRTKLGVYFDEIGDVSERELSAGKMGISIVCKGYKGGVPPTPDIY